MAVCIARSQRVRIPEAVVLKRKWLLGALVVLLVLALSYRWWLPLPGQVLVKGSEPAPADAIVVLGGDYAGFRVQAGAELVKEGYAPRVLISGNNWYFGLWECEVAIDFAVQNGQPREIFEAFRHSAGSTDEELQMLFAEASRRNWKSLLIVTSNFHTRRTGILVNRLRPKGLDVRVVSSPDRFFVPDQWWWHRESRKTLLYEWMKLGAVMVGGL